MTYVAAVVINWNGRWWIQRCLEAIRAQGDGLEVCVVDNGSADDSVDVALRILPHVRMLALGSNLGFGAAYNWAIARVEARWVALINNDVIVQPGWAARLQDAIASESVAAVGSKLLFLDRPDTLNHAGGRLTVLGSAYDVGFGEPDAPAHDRPTLCGSATGAAMLLRRDAFLDIGGFDERYFAYFEDADLCWRLWLRGYHVHYAPRARALHAYGGSTGGGRANLFRIEHCQTNRLQNMFKNLETTTLLATLPASFAFDAWRVGEFARARNLRAARALLRGTRRFWRMLPAVRAERRRVQTTRCVSDGELFRLGVLADLPTAAAEWRRLARVAPPA